MKKFLISAFLLAALLLGVALFTTPRVKNGAVVRIGETVISVDIADSAKERSLGLSGRKSLCQSCGMLFIFPKPGIYSFWMKDMLFPIDIAWIDKEKKIVGIEKHITPETFPRTFSAQSPILYVLELPAGYVNKKMIRIGDRIKLEI